MSTLEFRGAEFYCVTCEAKYGFLQPVGKPETPELMARHNELRAQYKVERDLRRAVAP